MLVIISDFGLVDVDEIEDIFSFVIETHKNKGCYAFTGNRRAAINALLDGFAMKEAGITDDMVETVEMVYTALIEGV